MAYGPILLAHASGDSSVQKRWPEAATLTAKSGVPLRLSSGNVTECDANDPWGAADVVVGISSEAGHNLAVAGTAEQGYSEATPPNQPSAKIIPQGAWIKDGKLGFYPADSKNVFKISLKAGQTYSQALVVAGTYYTLKKDATTGYWYLDSSDTTGNNAVAEIVGGVSDDNTMVLFRFKAGQRFFD